MILLQFHAVAAIAFAEATESGVAIITSLEKLGEISEGAGTVITRD